jgi:AcrR family transcriptional regulator
VAAGIDPPTSDQSARRAQEGGAGAALLDGRRERGRRTRESILATAVHLASVEGLEGLTIGRLARELGISKSGLFAHFGSKEELQLATVEAAGDIFVEAVIRPALKAPRGLPRLQALVDNMVVYMRREVFRGGCFFDAVRSEYDSRPPSPVRDTIASQFASWEKLVADCVRGAQREGHLDPDADPEQLAFELDAVCTAANVRYQFDHDPSAFDRAQRAIEDRIRAVTL